MKVVILKDAAEVAQYRANIFIKQISRKPESVLGLATGSTPVALYKELINAYKSGKVSFKSVTSFNLDEYLGLPSNHPQSYRYFMNEQLFDHIDIDKSVTFLIGSKLVWISRFNGSIEAFLLEDGVYS